MGLDFQQLFESAPAMYCVLTPDFTIVAVTDAYVRAAMRRRDDMIGRALFEVFPDNPADPAADGVKNLRASLDRVISSCLVDTMPIQRYDVRAPESEGGAFETHYWRPVNTPLFDDDGQLVYIIHSVENVTASETALRNEHARLIAAVNALEAANEELEAFSYSVAHDLRAPLRAIQGFSQALLEDYRGNVGERGQDYLQRVSSAALRMSELIDDLLTLSRISRAPLSRGPVDLSAIATRVASQLERQQDRSVRIAIADGLHANADPRLLQIVFENLLGNAWKFTSKIDHPEVEVGRQAGDGAVVFFVRDNGAGFDEAYASKLFAPFQRLHPEKEFGGTGIGLATVQRIVRRHGGRVWTTATVNGGATFYFTLPD